MLGDHDVTTEGETEALVVDVQHNDIYIHPSE